MVSGPEVLVATVTTEEEVDEKVEEKQAAEEVADEISPDELRRLMYYLVDTVLDRAGEVKPTIEFNDLSYSKPSIIKT